MPGSQKTKCSYEVDLNPSHPKTPQQSNGSHHKDKLVKGFVQATPYIPINSKTIILRCAVDYCMSYMNVSNLSQNKKIKIDA